MRRGIHMASVSQPLSCAERSERTALVLALRCRLSRLPERP